MEYFEFFLGWFLGIVSSVIAELIRNYFSQRGLKAQQQHSERIIRMQLYRDERAMALIELDELLKKRYETFSQFKKAVESFLDGRSAIFLPNELREDLKKELRSVDAFLHAELEDLYGPEPEPPEDYEDWGNALSPDEQLDEQIKSRLSGVKSSMRTKIRKHFSKE